MAVSIVVLLCTRELTIIIICANAFIFFLKESSVGTETAVSAEITEITESTQSTECAESTECTGYLQQIFPSKSREELAEIMASSSSLQEATNRLLDAESILFERGTLPIIFEVNL